MWPTKGERHNDETERSECRRRAGLRGSDSPLHRLIPRPAWRDAKLCPRADPGPEGQSTVRPRTIHEDGVRRQQVAIPTTDVGRRVPRDSARFRHSIATKQPVPTSDHFYDRRWGVTGFDREIGMCVRAANLRNVLKLSQTSSANKVARAVVSPIQLADLQLAFV
jgi:hypothetical protein